MNVEVHLRIRAKLAPNARGQLNDQEKLSYVTAMVAHLKTLPQNDIDVLYRYMEDRINDQNVLYQLAQDKIERIALNIALDIMPRLPIVNYHISPFMSRSECITDPGYKRWVEHGYIEELNNIIDFVYSDGANYDTNDKGLITMEFIVIDWLMSIPDAILHIDKNDAIIFKVLTTLDLYLLCMVLMPGDLFAVMSKSPQSMIFALTTGCVITSDKDPSVVNPDRFKYFADNFQPKEVQWLAQGFDYWFLIEGTYDDAIPSPYMRVLRPSMESYVALVNRLLELEGQGGVLGERMSPEVRNIAAALGMYPDLFDEYSTSSILTKDFAISAPYYMSMKEARPRDPLPLQFDNDDNDHPTSKNMLTLYQYSDNEVLLFYTPHWAERLSNGSRIQTRIFIADVYSENQQWFEWRILRMNEEACDNDNFEDPIMGEARGHGKHGLSFAERQLDPFIAYGPSGLDETARRRCFRVSELETSFTDSGLGPEFLDPDWRPPLPGQAETSVIDPLTGKPMRRTFPTHTIISLREILKRIVERKRILAEPAPEEALVGVQNLLNRIKDIFKSQDKAKELLDKERQLLTQHPEWHNDLLIYFSWLFLFGMWIRFWKGPGTPYPTVWTEITEGNDEYAVRDDNVIMELNVRGYIIDVLERKNPALLEHIRQLPYFYRDWRTGLVTLPQPELAVHSLRTHLIEGVLDFVQLSDFCMAQASDLLCGSAIVYLTQMLQVPESRLSDLLVYAMKLLRNYESTTISSFRHSSERTKTGKILQLSLQAVDQHSKVLDHRDLASQPALLLARGTATGHLPEGLGEILDEEELEDDDQRLGAAENGGDVQPLDLATVDKNDIESVREAIVHMGRYIRYARENEPEADIETLVEELNDMLFINEVLNAAHAYERDYAEMTLGNLTLETLEGLKLDVNKRFIAAEAAGDHAGMVNTLAVMRVIEERIDRMRLEQVD